jgi:hypothetical protein
LVVKRNGEPVAGPQLSLRSPADPGSYSITAEAPGRAPFHTSVLVGPASDDVVVTVPALRPVAPPPSGAGGGERSVIGYVLGGLGVASLGVGATFGVLALASGAEAKEACRTRSTCSRDEAVDARDRANAQGWVANVGLGLGVIGLAAGAYLLLAPPRGRKASAGGTAVTIAPGLGGSGVGVHF